MIKVIIFDVGGVLVRTSDWTLRRRWDERLGLPSGETEQMIFGDPIGTKAQLGDITTKELWDWVGKKLGLSSADLIAFQNDFWAKDALDQSLVTLLDRLRVNYRLAIISNAMDNLRHLLTNQYPIADRFELIVSSAEEHVMKPDEEIYKIALDRLAVEPNEAIFIDDNMANAVGASEVGMHTILFSPDLDIFAELARHGVQTGEEDVQ